MDARHQTQAHIAIWTGIRNLCGWLAAAGSASFTELKWGGICSDYLLAGLFFCEAVMVRLGKQFSPFTGASISVLTLVVIAYLGQAGIAYKYMAVVSNFGLGALIAVLCIKSRRLAEGNWIERTLHSLLVIFALHFFLRSVLTFNMLDGVQSTQQLINSQYWTLNDFRLIHQCIARPRYSRCCDR